MPTSNKGINFPIEQSELAQIDELAKAHKMSRTAFMRWCIREKIRALGHTPSAYEYQSGKKK